jgi:hypothetical protein
VDHSCYSKLKEVFVVVSRLCSEIESKLWVSCKFPIGKPKAEGQKSNDGFQWNQLKDIYKYRNTGCFQQFFEKNIAFLKHESKLSVLKSNFLAHKSGQSIFSLSSPLSCFITIFMATNISSDPRWPPKDVTKSKNACAIKKEHISKKFYLMHWRNLSFYKMWLTDWLNSESYVTLAYLLLSVWRSFIKEAFCQNLDFLFLEILC